MPLADATGAGKPRPATTPSAFLATIAMAWVLTLPVTIVLSGSLYWLFTQIV
jgi:phosphate/sulfate permease